MRGKVIVILLAAAILAPLWAGGATAGPPGAGPGREETAGIAATVGDKISYQGRLTDPATGAPLDGTYTMQFQLFTTETGGSPIWDSGAQSVSVDNGLFNVQLDVDQGDFDGQALWLRMGVGGQWLSPRREFLPVPYALSLRPGAEITGTLDGDEVLHVRNTGAAEGSTAIFGWAYATSGRTFGVWGDSRSSAGTGVYGAASAANGTTYGVSGLSSSTSGRGVYGKASAGSGATYGVYGESTSTSGRGMYGYATASSGDTYGVLGESASTAGRGVTGLERI